MFELALLRSFLWCNIGGKDRQKTVFEPNLTLHSYMTTITLSWVTGIELNSLLHCDILRQIELAPKTLCPGIDFMQSITVLKSNGIDCISAMKRRRY